MKKTRFSVEQITSVLQQVSGGVPVGDVCRQVWISEQTFYRWKKAVPAENSVIAVPIEVAAACQ